MVSYYLILYLSIFGGGILNFSDRLRYLRMSRGFSRKEVYEAIGSSKPSYYRYENGDSEPSTQKLIALAKYFNVSIDYLVGLSNYKDEKNKNEYTCLSIKIIRFNSFLYIFYSFTNFYFFKISKK